MTEQVIQAWTSVKEGEHCFNPSFQKGKAPIIIIELTWGWAISTPILLVSESEESLYHNHLSGTSSWESDVSVNNIFKDFR